MFDGIRNFMADYRRTFRGAALCDRAVVLYDANRYEMVVPMFQEALALVGTPSESGAFLYGVKHSVLLRATPRLAVAAARVGNRVLATSSIHVALPIVARYLEIASPDSYWSKAGPSWQRWATEYLRSVSGQA